jgi:hypothetical protein
MERQSKPGSLKTPLLMAGVLSLLLLLLLPQSSLCAAPALFCFILIPVFLFGCIETVWTLLPNFVLAEPNRSVPERPSLFQRPPPEDQ